jgi:hypothetical protein
MPNKPIRYLVWIPGLEEPASYNTAHGENALKWAKITAITYKGKIIAQMVDGSIQDIKNYSKD